MSYEAAPSTALLATHCCICGRPLRDAESLAAGIGPDCAENTGYYREALDPDVRREVNQIVHRLAVIQRCPEAVPLLARLRALGFGEIADRIDTRMVEFVAYAIAHDETDDVLTINLTVRLEPPAFHAYLRDVCAIPGRRSVKADSKLDGRPIWRTTLPNDRRSITNLARVLAKHLPGRVVRTPKGLTTIPTPDEVKAFVDGEVGHA